MAATNCKRKHFTYELDERYRANPTSIAEEAMRDVPVQQENRTRGAASPTVWHVAHVQGGLWLISNLNMIRGLRKIFFDYASFTPEVRQSAQ